MKTRSIGLAFVFLASSTLAQEPAKPSPLNPVDELARLKGEWVLSFKDSNGVLANLRLTFPETIKEPLELGWDSKGVLGEVAKGMKFGDGTQESMETRTFELIGEGKRRIIRLQSSEEGKPVDLPYEIKDAELILKAPLVVKEIVNYPLLQERWEKELKEKDRWVKAKPKDKEKTKK